MKRAFVALSFFVAVAALAQDPAEFGRASAGTIEGMVKRSSGLSGSLSLSMSQGRGPGYSGTFGGTLVPDKAWFFASAMRTPSITQTFGFVPTTTLTPARAIDANAIAQVGDRQSLNASFGTMTTLPKTFLSMHYTGIISPNAFFSASVSQTK